MNQSTLFVGGQTLGYLPSDTNNGGKSWVETPPGVSHVMVLYGSDIEMVPNFVDPNPTNILPSIATATASAAIYSTTTSFVAASPATMAFPLPPPQLISSPPPL